MELLWLDFRIGLRSLLLRPRFTLFTVLLLALGIGGVVAVFILLDTAFSHPLAVADLSRLVAVYRSARNPSGEFTGFNAISYPDYLDLRERAHRFQDLALFQTLPMNLTAGDKAERVRGMFVTANYFSLLGVRPELGRFFLPAEGAPGSMDTVAVLSEGAWIRIFGGDRGVLGRKIIVNGKSFTIVGVAPRGFKGTDLSLAADLWVPLPTFRQISPFREFIDDRGYALFACVGRLPAGLRIEQANAILTAAALDLGRIYPATDKERGFTAVPLLTAALNPKNRDRYVHFGKTLGVAFALTLLVACVSAGNLLLVRGLESRGELAVRHAVGGGRWRTLRPRFFESLWIFALATVASLPVARWILDLLWRLRPPELAQASLDLGLGPSALGFALLLSLLTCLLFGVLPAAFGARSAQLSSFRFSSPQGGLRRWSLHRILVAGQIALALVSLVGAGLFLLSLRTASRIGLGFDPHRIAVLTVAPGDQGYEENRGRIFYQDLLERVDALPGVRSAAWSENRLLRGAVVRCEIFRDGESDPVLSGESLAHRVNIVSPGFFRTVSIPLLAGRDFGDTDCPRCPRVAIINRTMAQAVWPGQNPLGKRLHLVDHDSPPVEVVGVAENAKYREVFEKPQFFVYLSASQAFAAGMTLHVRTAGAPEAILPLVRRQLRAVDPRLPAAEMDTMDHFVDSALWLERISSRLLGALALLALGLALLGVYATAAYSVAQRRHEIAIRIALGASPFRLHAMIARELAGLIGLGVLAGWGLAFGMKGLIAGQLHGVDPTAVWMYAVSALALFAAGLSAGYLASRRMLRIDSSRSLRSV